MDLIVSTQNGVIPIEIKMQKNVPSKKLAALSKYLADHNLPFGLLINQSDAPFWVTQNILEVPIGCL